MEAAPWGPAAAASRTLRPLLLLGGVLCGAVTHYDRLPCQPDEIQGEVQGASGYLCAPRCDLNNYNCPYDMPAQTNAQAQCMLQDIDRVAYCGLLCQVDAQCPSGSRCQQMKQVDVGICLFTMSFSDWARQGSSKKLAIGWPSQGAGRPAAGFQVAKTYASLQNLKTKYNIDDGDADMLTLKELLASLSTAANTAAPVSMAQSPSRRSDDGGSSLLSPFAHDINQFEKYMSHGLPGIGEEIHDTVWNIEHLDKWGTATMLLRCVFLIALVYAGLGSFINYNMKGARGIEMLPHIAFWQSYPGLVIDGIAYFKIIACEMTGVPVPKSSPDCDLRGGVRTGAGSFEALA